MLVNPNVDEECHPKPWEREQIEKTKYDFVSQ